MDDKEFEYKVYCFTINWRFGETYDTLEERLDEFGAMGYEIKTSNCSDNATKFVFVLQREKRYD